ncbi:DsrE family protein [Halosolutus amylolyticus]|uniref:DsrE family protein n=1 Tax=Halosolutus amylolyticus TaxID=2932267 RepID=A0ABD5PP40_9EURY|nr:DsrE family protein [Halosolutus amylolyticus]
MPDAAIVVLAGTEAPSDLGRVVNALQVVKEFDEAGDDVQLIFDGAGTQWVGELEDEDHDYHALYATVADHAQVCDYCAGAYGVEDEVEASEAAPIDQFEGHPSVRSLVGDGYEIITF